MLVHFTLLYCLAIGISKLGAPCLHIVYACTRLIIRESNRIRKLHKKPLWVLCESTYTWYLYLICSLQRFIFSSAPVQYNKAKTMLPDYVDVLQFDGAGYSAHNEDKQPITTKEVMANADDGYWSQYNLMTPDYFSTGSRTSTSAASSHTLQSPNYITYGDSLGLDNSSLSSSSGLYSDNRSSFHSPSYGFGGCYTNQSPDEMSGQLPGISDVQGGFDNSLLNWQTTKDQNTDNSLEPRYLFVGVPEFNPVPGEPFPENEYTVGTNSALCFPTNIGWNEHYMSDNSGWTRNTSTDDTTEQISRYSQNDQSPGMSKNRQRQRGKVSFHSGPTELLLVQQVKQFSAKNLEWSTYGESMVCGHCEETFSSPLDYANHLHQSRIRHDNMCPEESCVFHVLGFKFRWALRRHICNHHLRQYNDSSDSSRLVQKDAQRFLKHVYVCSVNDCSRAFYRLDSLLRHQRLLHGFLHNHSSKKRKVDWYLLAWLCDNCPRMKCLLFIIRCIRFILLLFISFIMLLRHCRFVI